MHTTISPAILYFGSIVLLITTENPDGSPNITPMSSAWFLGPRCMLGLASISQGAINILRTRQCVLNLPSENMGKAVNTLARTTGTEEIPPLKQSLGYRYVKDKFGVAGLTTQTAETVSPVRIKECPVQMEAELAGVHEMGTEPFLALEVKILRTHVEDGLRLAGYENRIDPEKWRPMVMSFQHLYGLTPTTVTTSTLAEIDEEKYRGLKAESINQTGCELRVS